MINDQKGRIVKHLLAVILVIGIGYTSAFAAQIQWKRNSFVHVSEEQPLNAFLTEFFSSQGLKVSISEAVKDETVSGNFNEHPQKILNQIASAFDLIWYYDGSVVYIYRSFESKSKVFGLKFLSIDKFMHMLKKLSIPDDRFLLKQIEDGKLVYVSGPERYVNLVEETAKALDQNAEIELKSKNIPDIIRFFKLKHAWAADVTFNFSNNKVTMPGVATVLRELITGKKESGVLMREEETDHSTYKKGKLATEVKGVGLPGKNKKKQNTQDELNKQFMQGYMGGGTVMADPRLNAVIIRDIPEKMPFYEQIIKDLDVPAHLVEIKATIMDVNTDALRDLGVEWAGKSTSEGGKRKITSIGSSGNSGSNLATMGFDSDATNTFSAAGTLAKGFGSGFNFTTIIGNLADEMLMAHINALEEDGNANVLSRPSVITFDNLEARLEHTDTFYVKVAGEREVNLFEVTAGIVLKVTPHIIFDHNETHIKLAVNIEDGNVASTEIEGIPVVKSSTINTQAVIKPNESLLIGGYIYENKSTTESKIPILGDIPYLGILFKRKQDINKKSERMFLISPRIVDSPETESMASSTPSSKKKTAQDTN